MRKIVYHGFYGFKNSGDDVFLEVAAWGSKKYFQADQTVFLGHDLPELITETRELGKPLFKGHDRLQTFKEVYNANYFISAGGSTFVNNKWHQLKRVALCAKKTVNPSLKNGAMGVSIGPFKSSQDEKAVQSYLKQLDFLALRDNRSFEYVNALDLPYTPKKAFDLAALLPYVYQDCSTTSEGSQTKKIIGVSVCPYESISDKNHIANETRRNDQVVALLKKLSKDSNQILFRFFIMNGHPVFGDLQLTQDIIRKSGILHYEIIPYQAVVRDLWNLIGQCHFMIATRLHAGILAAYNQVPFILNEYHQKCTDFLSDVGQSKALIVHDAHYLDFGISDHILEILDHKENAQMPEHIQKTQALALENFTIL